MLATRASNVTEVGRSAGHVSPAQIIREYRWLFGASPKQDAARLHEMSSGWQAASRTGRRRGLRRATA
ncbi:hypothetical protein AB0M48_12025 [Lentzea sp. NPDC051208]|uniref:hypothetical protein n=1 Tax=Lentzea sp. NPDC051208 TaxID=3154642 RepID=UPI003422139C